MSHPVPKITTQTVQGTGVNVYGGNGSMGYGGGGGTYTSGGKRVVCVGDKSSHGGTVITANTDGMLNIHGVLVAVQGALHSCPIIGHGITPIVAVTTKSLHNGKLILTQGCAAQAPCGALIQPTDRKVYVE